jgi:alanine-synthesizing transaminase
MGTFVSSTHAVRPSKRTEQIRYAIRDVMLIATEAQAAGRKLLSLNIGDPLLYDFPTPPHIIDAVHRAMLDGKNGYAPSQGIPEALEAIRAEAARDGIRNIHDVFTVAGVSEGIALAVAALTDPGENILIPSPGYPLYDAALVSVNAQGVHYRLDENNGWQPDLNDMEQNINSKTRAIVVINPNNPTGAVYSEATLRGILDIASRHGLVVFADEIYSKMILDDQPFKPMASLSSDVPIITFNGLSKGYLVPGFRVGWGIVSGPKKDVAQYCEAIQKLLRARLCSNHPAQYAIKPALEGDQGHIKVVKDKLSRRRDLTVAILNSFPQISCVAPQAAFYAFPKLKITRSDSEFVRDLILQTGVIVVPGSGFGPASPLESASAYHAAAGHFRVVFLPQEDVLEKGLRLIAEFAEKS